MKDLAYELSGNGRDAVILHGWGSSAAAMRGLAASLSREYRVINIDLYGFGNSSAPDSPLTVRDFAAGVALLFYKLRVKNAVLIGHSFGGKVAVELALHWPQYLSRLVLISASAVRPRRYPSYFFKLFSHKIKKRLVLSTAKDGSADYRACKDERERLTFINAVTTYYAKKELAKIALPTLILWGNKDKTTPVYMAKRLSRQIKASSLCVMDGGHFVYAEKTQETAAVIKDYAGG